MASTLSELRSQVIAEMPSDPNLKNTSQDTINENIRKAIRKIEQTAGYALPENLTTTELSASSQEENLPSNFKKIASPEGVKVGDSTPIIPIDYVLLLSLFDLDTASGQPNHFYVRKTSADQYVMGFYPAPNTPYTVTVPYYQSLTLPTDDTDESPLGEEYDEIIVVYSTYLTLRRFRGYKPEADMYFATFNELKKDILSNEQVPNHRELQMTYQRRSGKGPYLPKAIGPDYKY